MKMRVAIYQSVKHDWLQYIAETDKYEELSDYIRVSEVKTIHFTMLPDSVDSEINKRAVVAAQKEVDAALAKLEALK